MAPQRLMEDDFPDVFDLPGLRSDDDSDADELPFDQHAYDSSDEPAIEQRAPLRPGPWTDFGLRQRPSWWHYWEEGEPGRAARGPGPNRGPPPEEEAAAAADPVLDVPNVGPGQQPPPFRDQDDEIQPDYPESSADSPTWAEYWTRRRRNELWQRGNDAERQRNLDEAADAYAFGDDFDNNQVFDAPYFHQESFVAPPLVDGVWNKSTHVSKLIKDGFAVSVNITKRGKAPAALRFKDAAEAAYIDQMITDGILEEGPVEFTLAHFFIRKPGKLRLICNARKLNDAVKTPPRFNMKSHKTIQRLVANNAFHAADDLSNMFFSNKIAPHCRKYFGIRLPDGRFLRYTSMPFGFSWSPFIAHICVDEVCKRAIAAGHAVTHYLDDFHYFGSTKSAVLAARAFTRSLLRAANYSLNLSKVQPVSTTCDALGLRYNLRTKTVAPKPGFLLGLRETHVERATNNSMVTLREIASIVGALVFLNNAFPGSLSYLSALIAWVASADGRWRRTYEYRYLAPYVERALRLFEALPPCAIQAVSTPPVQFYTDATPTQIGIITDTTMMATRITPTKVYEAEAIAVQWLLEQPNLPKSFCVRVDNAALVFALAKGRSNTPEANYVCSQLLKLRCQGHVISFKWIPTDDNPADKPSRMPLHPSQVFVSPLP
jgi:hypothetical protein